MDAIEVRLYKIVPRCRFPEISSPSGAQYLRSDAIDADFALSVARSRMTATATPLNASCACVYLLYHKPWLGLRHRQGIHLLARVWVSRAGPALQILGWRQCGNICCVLYSMYVELPVFGTLFPSADHPTASLLADSIHPTCAIPCISAHR